MTTPEKAVDLEAEPAPRRRRRSNRALLAVAGGLPAAATFLSFLGPLHWTFDVLACFRVQYVVVLLVTLGVCVAARHGRMAAAMLVLLAVNVATIAPLYVPPGPATPPSQPLVPVEVDSELRPSAMTAMGFGRPLGPLRLAHLSARVEERSMDHLLEGIRNSDADIILLRDIDQVTLDERLSFRVAPFRVYHSAARDDAFGMALLERVSMRPNVRIEQAKTIDLPLGRGRVPAIEATIRWGPRRASLLAVHLAPLFGGENAVSRAKQRDIVVRWVQSQSLPPIVLGDFGMTPWSSGFRRLVTQTGLINSQLGMGVQATWPYSGGFPLGEIPIDHCLHDPELVTASRSTGPPNGADRRMLQVVLVWSDHFDALVDGHTLMVPPRAEPPDAPPDASDAPDVPDATPDPP